MSLTQKEEAQVVAAIERGRQAFRRAYQRYKRKGYSTEKSIELARGTPELSRVKPR